MKLRYSEDVICDYGNVVCVGGCLQYVYADW